MPYALKIRKDESPASAEGFAISDLWMLPLMLLALMFDRFSRHLTKLKAMRRTRPMPKDWQSFYPDLRTTEWAIRMFCFEGARQIICGEDLDLRGLSFDPEPPDSFCPPMPRSALAMHQRIEDTARFYADPERYVRRHAARIANRISDHSERSTSNPSNFSSGSNPSNPSNPSNFEKPNPNLRTAHPVAIRGPP